MIYPYNQGFPATYNPYVQQYQQNYQQMYQPQGQQTAQQPPQVQTSNNIVWVYSEKEATMYPVAPNTAVTMWNMTEPVIYLKQADASGRPSMKIYDLIERAESAQGERSGEGTKSTGYVTKEEFSALLQAVSGIDGAVTAVKSDMEAMRGDLYGLAGKKPNKRKEEQADE